MKIGFLWLFLAISSASLLRKRGYYFVSLEQALSNPA